VDFEKLRAQIEKTLREFQHSNRKMILGAYALIVAGVFVNHFWP
jgi:hypothetical protein